MQNITVDFSQKVGKMKPMHSVNNGPVYKFAVDQRITNIEPYKAAGIPYARNHDASFYATYGGEHIVDVNMIFTDFSKDPYDPASYDFRLTDDYLRVIELGGLALVLRVVGRVYAVRLGQRHGRHGRRTGQCGQLVGGERALGATGALGLGFGGVWLVGRGV